jgi:CMP-N-acetylneuraminic acid synthetase
VTDTLVVIPARGGSKRIPRKNLQTVAGKPLVAHAIEQAEAAEHVDEVVVSTEDTEIREVARAHGGSVPFERPEHLATDEAPSRDVVLHTLDWFASRGTEFDVVAMVQTTTPLRTAADVDGALRRLANSDADSVVSISEFRTPPFWAVTRGDDYRLESYLDDDYLWPGDEGIPRSQDLPTLFHPNGAVFAATTDAFRREGEFYTRDTVGFEMPPERGIDVDEPSDLEMVRALASRQSDDA